MSIDVLDGLERVGVPSYLADREGRIRWLNEEALSTFGDARGRLLSSLAAPDHAQRSREQLAKKVIGGAVREEGQDLALARREAGAGGGVAALRAPTHGVAARSRDAENAHDRAVAVDGNGAHAPRHPLAVAPDHVDLEVGPDGSADHLLRQLLA